MSKSGELAHTLERCDFGDADMPEAHIPSEEAFSTLYEQHLPGIYSYLLAHTRAEEDAADLAQQVFAQALTALPRYRKQGIPVRVWLFRIAHNLMVDFHRRRRPTVTWDALPASLHPISNDHVEATVVAREQVERLGMVLTRIEPEKRDLLALRFAAGLTVREIAVVLGRRDAAVRSEIRRLLHALHEELSHD